VRWRRWRHREDDLERELRSHLEVEASEQVENGLSPEEAQYAAKRVLGNSALIKEEVRDVWGWVSLERLKQDVIYALRMFARAPGFTTVVILTLALGIGATTAMFSVVDAVLLNPLPFPNQDRLVVIFEKVVDRPADPPFFASYQDFENWQRGNPQSFERLTVATWSTGGPQILTGVGPARDVLAMPVGIDFFPMLGIPPDLGRTFEPEDLNDGCTVVLKHNFWIEAFGGQRDTLGRHVEINREPCTVIGVMPPGFTFYPDAAEMWMLISPNSVIGRNPRANVGVFGLLKSGISIKRAENEVESLYKNSPRPDLGVQLKPVVYPLAEQFARLTGPTLRLSVVVLFGAVTFVLLIGCLNIANLLLGKSVARQKEIAVRAALGSGRARIVRQLLTEAMLLSVIGASLGIVLAIIAVYYFRVLSPIEMPPGNPVTVNIAVVGFTASTAVVTALLFGLIPALKTSRVDLIKGLRVSAHSASLSRAARILQRVLVIVEVALSLALLVGAGLLIQTVQRLSSVPLGFQTNHVSVMPIILPRWTYSTRDQRARFFRAALDRTASRSGAGSTAVTSLVPPDGWGGDAVVVDGRPELTPGVALRDVLRVSVSSDYFKIMGVPLQLGQIFDDRDNENSPAVALVNEAFVRTYFPNQNAIGSRIKILSAPGSAPPWLTIVGIVGNEKHQDFFGPMGWHEIPIVYRPITQEPPFRAFFVVRALADTTAVRASLRKRIESLDNDAPTGDLQMMDERLARTLSYPRFRAIVLTAFAAVALLLAAIGIYAVLSQLIGQRMQEFGIRMALGAQKRDLLKLVLREGLVLTLAGLAAGFAIALSVAGLLKSLIYGLKTTDPWTLAAGSLMLLFVAFSAMYVPAMRASRVDPKVAIRYE